MSGTIDSILMEIIRNYPNAAGAPRLGCAASPVYKKNKLSRNAVKKIEDRICDEATGARRQKASPSQICIAEAMQAPIGLTPWSRTGYRTMKK